MYVYVCWNRYSTLIRNTYGIRDYVSGLDDEDSVTEALTGCRYEQIANTGRYYTYPTAPYPSDGFDWQAQYVK